MKTFWQRNKFFIIYWSIAIPAIFIFATVITWYSKPNTNSDNISSKPNIALAHIDSDGTVWVEINGNLYYLYLDDNGTMKRLEMK